MKRRDFVATALSSLATCTCGYARRASAKPVIRGCRIAAASANDWSDLRQLMTDRFEQGLLPEECLRNAKMLGEFFGVRPGFSWYNDEDGENALAVSYVFFPRQGPDGTVIIGKGLIFHFSETKYPRLAEYEETYATFATFVVIAHEFAHILQYKEGVIDSWEMEPHADFMAGWRVAQAVRRGLALRPFYKNGIDNAAETMFELGDTVFNDREHHGEPHYRAVMVRAGFDAGSLGVKEAFEKGLVWAKLERKPA